MHDQTELGGFEIQIAPFPDETIFSWCSRYHRLAASAFDKVTALHLFGTSQTAITHDFTPHLDALATRANGALGSSLEIVHQRTLLPFYLPFKPAKIGLEAIAAMQGYGIAHMKYRLGLLTSGLGAAHPLTFLSILHARRPKATWMVFLAAKSAATRRLAMPQAPPNTPGFITKRTCWLVASLRSSLPNSAHPSGTITKLARLATQAGLHVI